MCKTLSKYKTNLFSFATQQRQHNNNNNSNKLCNNNNYNKLR